MTRRLTRGIVPMVAAYFAAWTAVGLFFFTRELSRRIYRNEPTAWQDLLTVWLVGEYIWGLVALLVIWCSHRWPLERQVLGRRVALHLVLSTVIGAAQLALEAAAYKHLGMLTGASASSFLRAWAGLLVVGWHGNLISYWVILAVHTAYRHYRKVEERDEQKLRLELKTAELSGQLMRAQMSALKMQLQPHFLFNTLNAIMVLVRRQAARSEPERQQSAARAEEMLGRLSDLLRCVLDDGEAQEVPLHREIEYVRLYLSIEEVRFEDRLKVTIDVAPDVLDAAVPHMALQPIVENALRHGIARTSSAGTIAISAIADHGRVAIRVKDDGPGLQPSEPEGGWGIGLTNTRARLAHLYGDAASLTIENGAAGAPGVTVTMVLPYHPVPDDPARDRSHASDFADR